MRPSRRHEGPNCTNVFPLCTRARQAVGYVRVQVHAELLGAEVFVWR
jgi:hypothetical protein